MNKIKEKTKINKIELVLNNKKIIILNNNKKELVQINKKEIIVIKVKIFILITTIMNTSKSICKVNQVINKTPVN